MVTIKKGGAFMIWKEDGDNLSTILTAIAAIITAIAGLIHALK